MIARRARRGSRRLSFAVSGKAVAVLSLTSKMHAGQIFGSKVLPRRSEACCGYIGERGKPGLASAARAAARGRMVALSADAVLRPGAGTNGRRDALGGRPGHRRRARPLTVARRQWPDCQVITVSIHIMAPLEWCAPSVSGYRRYNILKSRTFEDTGNG